MIRLLSLLLLTALTSCATKQATSTLLPPPPPRAVAVAPEASRLHEQITTADHTAANIATGAAKARQAATAARQEVARLKQNKTATEAELTKLWQDLQTVETRNLFLETETSRLSSNLTEARKTATTLQQYASAKDTEADQLRAGNDHLTHTVGSFSKQLAAANKATDDHRSHADRLLGEIRLYRITLGITAAIIIAWISLKLFLPPRLI